MGRASSASKYGVCNYLMRFLPSLVDSTNIENWKRRLEVKMNSPRDGRRAEAKKRIAPRLSKEDRHLLVQSAVFAHDGSIAAAWREVYQDLSQEVRVRYSHFGDGRTRKSYVPHRIVAQIKEEVEWLLAHHRSPRQADLKSPPMRPEHSYYAGDYYSTDDDTMDVYSASREKNSRGGHDVLRHQYFPIIDVRSKRIFAHGLLNAATWNGLDVRFVINKTYLDNHFPRIGNHFERGTFLKSRFLGGRLPRNIFGLAELEDDLFQNWSERLQIKNAHTLPGNPRGKIVENVLRLIKRHLPREQMYCGRNEQEIKYDRVRTAIAAVEAGRKTPEEVGMLYEDEWDLRLKQIEESYNAEPQESVVFGRTMSPNEAWETLQPPDNKSVTRWPQELRYRLGHREPNKLVKIGGIRLKLPGNVTRVYWHPEIYDRHLLGQLVTVWFDPTQPEMLTVETAHGEVFVLPEQTESLPRFGASREQYLAASTIQRGEKRARRMRYQQLAATWQPPTRPLVIDPVSAAKIIEVNRQQRELVAVQRREQKQQAAEQAVATRYDREILEELADVPPPPNL
ncbi:MAG TPA: hypothetical protein VFZ59_26340 [Verrucomicrobiae bacterium]|nr:hypothetical protein [Verrucomicrobiae bacterium]